MVDEHARSPFNFILCACACSICRQNVRIATKKGVAAAEEKVTEANKKGVAEAKKEVDVAKKEVAEAEAKVALAKKEVAVTEKKVAVAVGNLRNAPTHMQEVYRRGWEQAQKGLDGAQKALDGAQKALDDARGFLKAQQDRLIHIQKASDTGVHWPVLLVHDHHVHNVPQYSFHSNTLTINHRHHHHHHACLRFGCLQVEHPCRHHACVFYCLNMVACRLLYDFAVSMSCVRDIGVSQICRGRFGMA